MFCDYDNENFLNKFFDLGFVLLIKFPPRNREKCFRTHASNPMYKKLMKYSKGFKNQLVSMTRSIKSPN